MTAPSAVYTDAIREARLRGYRLSASAQRQLIAAFRDAATRVEFDLQASDNPLTQARAESLRQQIDGILRELERQTGRVTNATVRKTVDDVVAIHERVLTELFERHTGEMSAKVEQALSRVNTRAVAVLAARNDVGGGAAGFRTLMKYHLEQAAPDLDRLISSAVANGVSSQRLTRDVADFLANGVAPLDAYGLSLSDTEGLASLQHDARRIAVSETLNALRESNAQSLAASQVVEAVRWQRSGNHGKPDECDLLAEADLFGMGGGWYPPDRIPVAPHPWCKCTAGETRLRHPSTWNQPRDPAPALAVDWETFDPSEHLTAAGDWSDLRTSRAVTALRRSVLDTVGRRARRAA